MTAGQQRQQRTVLVVVLVGLVFAALSLGASLLNTTQLRSATRADVLANRALTEQVRVLQEQGNADVREHRVANQRDHDCLVALALLITDPARDRAAAVVPPPQCRNAPAAHRAGSPAPPS